MVFRRGSNYKRPINSIKNILDATSIGVAGAVNTTIDLITTVNSYAGGAIEVPTGAVVRAVYVFIQIIPQAAQGICDFYIAKADAATVAVLPVPGVTGGDPQRRFILHEEHGLPGVFNNGAAPLTFRGVIKLPRGRQRIGEGDRMVVVGRCSTAYDFCVKAIYKFYT